MNQILKTSTVISIFVIVLQVKSANGYVELNSGYNIPFGDWKNVFGSGFSIGGMTTISFSEYLNPGVGGFLSFPKTGHIVEDEYRRVQETDYVSLFTVTGFFYLVNRINLALSENTILTIDTGYGVHSQRDYATVLNDNYESVDNLSGYGPFIGLGIKRSMNFSVFNFIQPFMKFYYSPNKVYYLVVDRSSSCNEFFVSERRLGVFLGISLISEDEER